MSSKSDHSPDESSGRQLTPEQAKKVVRSCLTPIVKHGGLPPAPPQQPVAPLRRTESWKQSLKISLPPDTSITNRSKYLTRNSIQGRTPKVSAASSSPVSESQGISAPRPVNGIPLELMIDIPKTKPIPKSKPIEIPKATPQIVFPGPESSRRSRSPLHLQSSAWRGTNGVVLRKPVKPAVSAIREENNNSEDDESDSTREATVEAALKVLLQPPTPNSRSGKEKKKDDGCRQVIFTMPAPSLPPPTKRKSTSNQESKEVPKASGEPPKRPAEEAKEEVRQEPLGPLIPLEPEGRCAVVLEARKNKEVKTSTEAKRKEEEPFRPPGEHWMSEPHHKILGSLPEGSDGEEPLDPATPPPLPIRRPSSGSLPPSVGASSEPCSSSSESGRAAPAPQAGGQSLKIGDSNFPQSETAGRSGLPIIVDYFSLPPKVAPLTYVRPTFATAAPQLIPRYVYQPPYQPTFRVPAPPAPRPGVPQPQPSPYFPPGFSGRTGTIPPSPPAHSTPEPPPGRFAVRPSRTAKYIEENAESLRTRHRRLMRIARRVKEEHDVFEKLLWLVAQDQRRQACCNKSLFVCPDHGDPAHFAAVVRQQQGHL